MLYRDLTAKHGIKTRQCGNKLIAIVKPINDDMIRLYGFEAAYDSLVNEQKNLIYYMYEA